MTIHIFGLNVLSDADLAKLKGVATEAGHDVVAVAKDDLATLKAIIPTKFPALASAFTTTFDELANDTTVTGYARMEKAVAMVLPKVPEIAAELAHITDKSFWLDLGQTLFTKTVAGLEQVAGEVLAAL